MSDSKNDKDKKSAATLCGIFHDVTNSDITKNEKGAWERDVVDRINKGDDSFLPDNKKVTMSTKEILYGMIDQMSEEEIKAWLILLGGEKAIKGEVKDNISNIDKEGSIE